MTNEFYHLFTFICHLYVSLAIASLLLPFGCILVSEDCHSKVPFTGQLKITDIYCFTVWRLEVQNQVADKATVSLKPIKENPSFPLTSWWLAGNPCHCLVCNCNTSISASIIFLSPPISIYHLSIYLYIAHLSIQLKIIKFSKIKVIYYNVRSYKFQWMNFT